MTKVINMHKKYPYEMLEFSKGELKNGPSLLEISDEEGIDNIPNRLGYKQLESKSYGEGSDLYYKIYEFREKDEDPPGGFNYLVDFSPNVGLFDFVLIPDRASLYWFIKDYGRLIHEWIVEIDISSIARDIAHLRETLP